MPRHILFAAISLGLGHATRTLPIIKSHVQIGWRVSALYLDITKRRLNKIAWKN